MAEGKINLFNLRILWESGADSPNQAISPDPQPLGEYEYSIPQLKMLYLRKTLLEALRFKKYYARKLSRYTFWNRVGNFIIAAAASTSFTSATFFKDKPWGQETLKWLLLFSMVATILKPQLKLDKAVARFARLQREYLNIYQTLDRLETDIQHTGQMTKEHERRFSRLRNAFDRLGKQNEPVENNKQMAKIMDEIEISIPPNSLWLPPSE